MRNIKAMRGGAEREASPVYAMHCDGMTVSQIARALGMRPDDVRWEIRGWWQAEMEGSAVRSLGKQEGGCCGE